MPYEMLTKSTIKAIFSGENKLLKLKDVNFIQSPKYDEISFKNLYDRFKLDGIKDYFPDSYAKGR